jgi:hypothetical protein
VIIAKATAKAADDDRQSNFVIFDCSSSEAGRITRQASSSGREEHRGAEEP